MMLFAGASTASTPVGGGELVYLHGRYYDPAIGRFISADPVPPSAGNVAGNRYGYGANSPANYVDLTGSRPTYRHRGKPPGNPILKRYAPIFNERDLNVTGAIDMLSRADSAWAVRVGMNLDLRLERHEKGKELDGAKAKLRSNPYSGEAVKEFKMAEDAFNTADEAVAMHTSVMDAAAVDEKSRYWDGANLANGYQGLRSGDPDFKDAPVSAYQRMYLPENMSAPLIGAVERDQPIGLVQDLLVGGGAGLGFQAISAAFGATPPGLAVFGVGLVADGVWSYWNALEFNRINTENGVIPLARARERWTEPLRYGYAQQAFVPPGSAGCLAHTKGC